jgi:hypothetical protein
MIGEARGLAAIASKLDSTNTRPTPAKLRPRTWGSSHTLNPSDVVPEMLPLRRLIHFDQVAIGIANVAADFAVMNFRFGQEACAARAPKLVTSVDVSNAQVQRVLKRSGSAGAPPSR